MNVPRATVGRGRTQGVHEPGYSLVQSGRASQQESHELANICAASAGRWQAAIAVTGFRSLENRSKALNE